MHSSPKHSRRRSRATTWVPIGIGAVIVVILLCILADVALYHNKVHAGVTVSGYEFAGMTRDEAETSLSSLVEQAQQSQIVLVKDGNRWPVMPDHVGTKIDVAGTVADAMAVGTEGNILSDLWKRFTLYFGGQDVPIQGSVDAGKLDKLLQDVAEKLDVPPVNAGLAIDGDQISVIEGKSGLVVDQDRLSKELKALLFSLHATELPITMVEKQPAIQAADTGEAVQQAKTMIGDSVTMRHNDGSWTITPSQIAAYMDFTTENEGGTSKLVPFISATKAAPVFAEAASQVEKKPVDATWKTDGETATLVPAVLGEALDPEKTAEAITQAALSTTDRTAEVQVTTTEPERTTAEAEAMGIVEKISSYTTEWVGTANRQHNVALTAKYASDVLLAPGQEYDFDKQIGPRTPERGYRTAPGIVGPGKLEDVFGGGICQVSTTLFNAVFFAGLDVTERYNHSIYIDHYPKGRDATVTAGGKNLRWVNDTDHWILVRSWSDGVTTTFVLYGTNPHRKVTYTTSDFYNVVGRTEVTVTNPSLGVGTTQVKLGGQSGKQIKVVRTVKDAGGNVIHKDTFISTFPMVPRQIEVGTSSTTTTSTTVPTSTTTTVTPST